MRINYDIVCGGDTVCPNTWKISDVCEVFHRIYYVRGGEAYYEYNGDVFPLKPGHLYVFPILHPYSMQHCAENPLDVLWFHVETSFQLCSDVFCMKVKSGSKVAYILELLRLLSKDADDYERLSKVFEVFMDILLDFFQTESYPGQEVQQIINYIDQNAGNHLTVEALADHVGMERSYFSRKFKKIFQMSPNQYIIAKKMKIAARELTLGASIAVVTRAAGYEDEKSFSRAFKKYTGISPAQYRNNRILKP